MQYYPIIIPIALLTGCGKLLKAFTKLVTKLLTILVKNGNIESTKDNGFTICHCYSM